MKPFLQFLKRILSQRSDNYYQDCITLDPSQSLAAWEKLTKSTPDQFNWLKSWERSFADQLSQNPDLVKAVLKDLEQAKNQ